MANIKEVVQDAKRAEAITHLQDCFAKEYDLTTPAGQQAMVEGVKEFGKHIALTCTNATVSITVGTDGLTSMSVTTTPKPA